MRCAKSGPDQAIHPVKVICFFHLHRQFAEVCPEAETVLLPTGDHHEDNHICPSSLIVYRSYKVGGSGT